MDTVQKKRPLAAVIFDMDGLMFDTERIVKRSWDEAAPLLAWSLWGIIFITPWE